MSETFNPWDYKLKKDEVNYVCSFNDKEVIFGEYEENPHGVNNESRIDLKEFVDGITSNSINFRSFIKNAFGQEKLERFIYFVKTHKF
jgi:hypothetical protein